MKGIIGTAGHIDHGKTALIAALTGEDTDRLPEERERGISIDLGFSHLDLEAGRLGIVDVPGHEDFIRNMLAGATGIDVLLLVVAADEGVMPQTREHVAIAELLGVHRAVVALTKVDLVDDDWLGLAHDDVAGFLQDTPFAGAPLVPVSARSGVGLDALREAIAGVFQGARGTTDDLFRLPIDRTFTVRGTGTVVTGTVWSGRLETGATVRLLPGGPEARVRGLQVHGGDVGAIEAGERAAIALTGIDRDQTSRGMAVVADEAWRATYMLTVRLRVLPATEWTIEANQRVRVHLGTAEVMARVAPLDGRNELRPGDEAWVQLRLEAPLVARAGDRIVLRSYSPVTTIGGGVVAEPTPDRRATLTAREQALLDLVGAGSRPEAVRAVIAAGGERGVDVAALPILTGATPNDVQSALQGGPAAPTLRVGDRAFDADAVDAVRRRLVEDVERHHTEHPLRPGVDPERLRRAAPAADSTLVDAVLESLQSEGTLEPRNGRIARAGWSPALSETDVALRNSIARTLAEAGASPPRLDELTERLGASSTLPELVELLEIDGVVTRLEHDLFIDTATLRGLVDRVRETFAGRQDLSPGDFREVVAVSRRHLMPLLAYLDREEVTVRGRDGRAVPAS